MEKFNRLKAFMALGLALGSVMFALWGTFVSAETRETTEVVGEGPGKTGSDAYRDAGADGTGLKIAIIDNRFASLQMAIDSGDAPPWGQIKDTFDFAGGGMTTGTYTHGTAVLEVIYDHAPGADYYLYRVSSGLDASDLTNAVNRAVAKEVDIISMSITYFNQGWEDGSGVACAAVKTATDAGILVFAAAGNFAKQHWHGIFDDPDSDNLHNWSGVDEHQDVRLKAGDTMVAYLQWDLSGGDANYDFYVYDSIKDSILDSSTNPGNSFEDLRYGYGGPGTQLVKIRVRKASGNATGIQFFARYVDSLEYVTGGSIASPANSDEPNVISVGAVDQKNYDSLPYTSGIIQPYSSLGPTNSDSIQPDLVAPNKCTTLTRGRFGGTSGATPNASGTGAAFWSADTNLSATGIRHLLHEMAEIFKDWGDTGIDTVYGRGGIRLHTYRANTIWVDRDAGNTDGSDTIPYYYVVDAQDSATAGGRVVFLGDNYPGAIILNKELLYESIGGSAVIGK